MAMIHVSRSGAQLGVFDEDRVREGLATGEFIGTDLGWTEGMAAWRPLSELESFRTVPPPPVTPAAATADEPGATAAAADQMVLSAPTTTADRTGLPWENREQLGFVNGLWETILMVLTKPNDAFGVMRREGNFLDPLLYAVLLGTFGSVVAFIYQGVLQSVGLVSSGSGDGLAALAGFGATSILMLVLMPVILLLGLFVGSAITHLCLMLVGGANQSYETTLRVMSYSSGSASVLQVIPLCGGIISALYTIVLNCIGLARAHQTDTWRAVVAVLLPAFLCCGLVAFVVTVIVGSAGGACPLVQRRCASSGARCAQASRIMS
jgi:hypothetical protein